MCCARLGGLSYGCSKYKGRAFKVLNFTRWVVVISGPTLLEEIRRTKEDEFSLYEALDSVRISDPPAVVLEHSISLTSQDFCLSLAIGFSFVRNNYHAKIVRTTLTNSLPALFSVIQDELAVSTDLYIPVRDGMCSHALHPRCG